MCSAIEFRGVRHYFKDTPSIPVLRRDGEVEWVQWGLPYGADVPGIPSGACARRESIASGKWTRLKPVPVKIPCTAFMERDRGKSEHWFDVSPRLAIQGALILLENKLFIAHWGNSRAIVYVVTEPAAGEVADIHDRMPRLVPIAA